MSAPANTRRNRALTRKLLEAFSLAEPRVKEALLVILETVVEIEDRKRASRLLEAVAMLIALAPRRVPAQRYRFKARSGSVQP
jgi:hypothetical protein